MNIALMCSDSNPTFMGLFDFSIAPALLFYSYTPIVILALIFGLYIYSHNRQSIQGKLILYISIAFSLWVINTLVQWTAASVAIVHFSWQLTIIFEILIFIFSLYFCEVFAKKSDATIAFKAILSVPIIASAILLPSRFNISGFDLPNCQSNVGTAWPWIYIFEVSIIFYIVISAIIKTKYASEKSLEKKQVVHMISGIAFFLLIFALSNVFGDVTKIYQINLVGPIGMVIFLAFLTYTTVKYNTFNIKILGTQALVVSICVLVASLLFVENLSIIHSLIYVTSALLVVLGIFLIKSVKKEVKQREQIQTLALDLEKINAHLIDLNKQKSEFVSYATHQLRAPLTAMKGYTSMLLDGDLGVFPDMARDAIIRISDSSKTLANVVDDYLNVSRIELGTMKYFFEPLDFREMLTSVVAELKPSIEKSPVKLNLSFTVAGTDGRNPTSAKANTSYDVTADRDKFKQVVMNLIDNSLKYTNEGEIDINLCRDEKNHKIVFTIKDTGIGIDPSVMPKLFSKFTRASNANSTNIRGTGLGLFVARDVVLAHKGKIWAESPGEGRGSTFVVELDVL